MIGSSDGKLGGGSKGEGAELGVSMGAESGIGVATPPCEPVVVEPVGQ